MRGEGRQPAVRSRWGGGEEGCAAEATALSLPGRKEAGKGAAAAAAAAAAVEYSVPKGGGKGSNRGARGGAVRARGERGLSCGIDVRSLGFPQRREHG